MSNLPELNQVWLDDLDTFLGTGTPNLSKPGHTQPFDQRNYDSRTSFAPPYTSAITSFDTGSSATSAELDHGHEYLPVRHSRSLSASEQDDGWRWTTSAPYDATKMPDMVDYISEDTGFSSMATPKIIDNTPCTELDLHNRSALGASHNLSHGAISASNDGAITSDTFAVIGSVLMNGKFKCNHTQCVYKMFSRPAELKRHHATTHASQRPQHWCPSLGCERSMAIGSKAFSRKDKLKDHLRQMHGKTLLADGSVLQVEL